ncbi:flavin reductase family protein [Georgenia sp. SYP-B2076]|uniref:flavin reductase family protein n=1 Tax=Georgenia sp. SYP-B2076 TaxID=2495881 RepID=UPI000F8E116A|nr:flavin reductase family protein [Georgenia sp. SYP-B2076]
MSVDHSLELHPIVAGAGEVGEDDFKAIFRHHPAGVAVITLRTPHGPVGFTATSVISVSAAPPMLAFSLAATSSSRRALEENDTVVVNLLAAEQHDVATRFAARGVDRFAGVDWCPLPAGEPVLGGTTAWVRGRIEQRVPVGDSLLITVHALLAEHSRSENPLVYKGRTYHHLGTHSRLA